MRFDDKFSFLTFCQHGNGFYKRKHAEEKTKIPKLNLTNILMVYSQSGRSGDKLSGYPCPVMKIKAKMKKPMGLNTAF